MFSQKHLEFSDWEIPEISVFRDGRCFYETRYFCHDALSMYMCCWKRGRTWTPAPLVFESAHSVNGEASVFGWLRARKSIGTFLADSEFGIVRHAQLHPPIGVGQALPKLNFVHDPPFLCLFLESSGSWPPKYQSIQNKRPQFLLGILLAIPWIITEKMLKKWHLAELMFKYGAKPPIGVEGNK